VNQYACVYPYPCLLTPSPTHTAIGHLLSLLSSSSQRCGRRPRSRPMIPSHLCVPVWGVSHVWGPGLGGMYQPRDLYFRHLDLCICTFLATAVRQCRTAHSAIILLSRVSYIRWAACQAAGADAVCVCVCVCVCVLARALLCKQRCTREHGYKVRVGRPRRFTIANTRHSTSGPRSHPLPMRTSRGSGRRTQARGWCPWMMCSATNVCSNATSLVEDSGRDPGFSPLDVRGSHNLMT
jgi:hypothetical protein